MSPDATLSTGTRQQLISTGIALDQRPEVLWATPDEAAEALFILIRPGYLVALFLAGWAANILVFTHFRIDYGAVLGLAKDEHVSPQSLCMLVFCVGVVLGLLRLLALSQGVSHHLLSVALLLYPLGLVMLAAWLPGMLSRRARWRAPLAQALWRRVFPDRDKEVPFAEVLVADGLTSLAKAFFDLTLGSCMVASSVDFSPSGLAQMLLADRAATMVSAAPSQVSRSMLGDAYDQCSRSAIPFLVWTLPFVIRARQCLVSARLATDTLSRILHKVNLMKYLSALPMIMFAYLHAHSASAVGHETNDWFGAEDFEVMWALAAVVNSVFSFVWDLVMDWGLLHPAPLRNVHFGLRPILLFRGVWGFYHIAIVCNLLGRTLWSLRWSPQAKLFLGSFFLTSLQQAAEVARRCLWSVLRVEWECIRRNVHRSDKHFPV